MFHTGALIAFCGLLAQTRPLAMTPPLALSNTDFSESLSSALSDGLLSEGLLPSLENAQLSITVKTSRLSSKSMFGGLRGKSDLFLNVLKKIKAKIRYPQLQTIEIGMSPDGRRLYVTIPVTMTISIPHIPIYSIENLYENLRKMLPGLVENKVCFRLKEVVHKLNTKPVEGIISIRHANLWPENCS